MPFKRYCNKCDKLFQPKTKFSYVCDECYNTRLYNLKLNGGFVRKRENEFKFGKNR